MNPARAHNIADLRAAARRRLPRVVFDYLEGGAEDHVSARANRESFESVFERADQALYQAKHRGRSRVELAAD